MKVSENSKQVVLSLYVDDMLVTGNNSRMLQNFKVEMEKVFDMSDLGYMHYFLGMEVHQENNGIFLSQKKICTRYFEKVQNDYMQSCFHSTYFELKGFKELW